MSRRRLIVTATLVVLLSISLVRFAAAQNYVEPGSSAPNGAIAPPLNASDSAQRKSGTLIIGPAGGASKVCLNADVSLGVTDPTNCISTWGDLASRLGGPYLNRSQSIISGNPFAAASYAQQNGYVRVRSLGGALQSFTTIASAPAVCWDVEVNAACTRGNCRCLNTNQACEQNSDCRDPATNQPSITTGVFSTDGGNASAYAGYFGGKFFVQLDPFLNPGQICLNGSGVGNCISSWDQVNVSSSGYVKLQANPPTEKQVGGAAISGFGQLSSVITGDPEANGVGNKICGAGLCNCGDGLCTGYEVNLSFACPVDCAAVGSLNDFSLAISNSQVAFTAGTGTQSPSGQVKVLVVKSAGTPTSFAPQIGFTYQTGMQFGTSTVVYAGQANQNAAVAIPNDASVTRGTLYYYRAWQGNLYPRYGTSTEKSIRYFRLTVSRSGGRAGNFVISEIVDGSGDSINCGSTCIATYAEGSVVNLLAVSTGGYTLTWGGACSGESECTVTMTSDKTVNVVFQR